MHEDNFQSDFVWPAYVDFMMVLFFIALGIGGFMYLGYMEKIKDLERYQNLVKEVISINEELKQEFKRENIFIDLSTKDKIKLKGDFYFDFNRDSLKDETAKRSIIVIGNSIKKILDLDSNKFKYSIVIEGHTDNIGTDEYNNNLSYRRALSISNLWKSDCKLVIPDYEIVAAGFGRLKPFVSNTNDSLRSINRRIEISVVPKMSEFTKLIQE